MIQMNRSTTGAGGVRVINQRMTAALLVALGLGLGFAPQADAVFDDLEVGPRARGLGGSYAGLSDDATGLFYNPAGLVGVESMDAYLSVFRPFNYGFSQASVAALAIPTEDWGTIAIGYSGFRVDYEGTVLSAEHTFTLGQSLMLMEDLSSSLAFGYAVNVFYLDYPTLSVGGYDLGSETTYGIDIGFQARLRDRTTAGVFVKNLNNPAIGDPVESDLPQRISGGMAYRPYDGVVTAVEVEKEVGEDIQFHGGVEFRIAEPLVLRFGAQSKPNLFDAGAGIAYRDVKIDFTYTHHPVLDATFHYGLGLRF